ncbi:MAG: NAD(P)H-binding protein [Pseudomonadota bacterium]
MFIDRKSDGRVRRTALLAGATGLVGRELLLQLAAEPAYGAVQVLARRPLDLPLPRKLQTHIGPLVGARSVPAADDVYIALGTTLRAAGSQAAFRRIDLDLVVHLATLARAAGARRLAVVSSLGADARSAAFYNRTKGEMEAAVQQLGYERVVIVRPSLLAGERDALGQPPRPIERWSLRLSAPLARWLPAALRPVPAASVARTMLRRVLGEAPGGVQIVESRALQPDPATPA